MTSQKIQRKQQEEEWVLSVSVERILQRRTKLPPAVCERLAKYLKMNYETSYILRYKERNTLTAEQVRTAVNVYENASDLNREVRRFLNVELVKISNLEEKKTLEKKLRAVEAHWEVAEIKKEIKTPGKTKTKADEARKLGFSQPALSIMGGQYVSIGQLSNEFKMSQMEVKNHLIAIMADSMNKSLNVKKVARQIAEFELGGKLTIDVKWDVKRWESDKKYREATNQFLSYPTNASAIQDHQICSLNRASHTGIIDWDVGVPYKSTVHHHPYYEWRGHPEMQSMINCAFNLSFKEYFQPKIANWAKEYLTEKSMDKGCLIFQLNTQQLFLIEGVKNKYVIALDPGSVVKAAFLRPSGEVIEYNDFHVYDNNCDQARFDNKGIALLTKWSRMTNGVDIDFSIGDGQNSFFTQIAVQLMIENEYFPSDINVGFRVVCETGASRYSVSPEAEQEFPGMAPGHISAISIGRRLIDPVEEYIKMNPKHLSKGQYQHSVEEKLLMKRVKMAIRDTVSLIGADLNTASAKLLQSICGLDKNVANNIVKYRQRNGPFRSREELKNVKGVDEEVFEQSSGFLTVKKIDGVRDWNPLDDSPIHPTDYEHVQRVMKRRGWTVEQLKNGWHLNMEDLTDEEMEVIDLITFKPTLTPAPRFLKQVPKTPADRYTEPFKAVVKNVTQIGVFVDPRFSEKESTDGLILLKHYEIHEEDQPPKYREYPKVGEEIDVILERIGTDGPFLKPVWDDDSSCSSSSEDGSV